jgi:hypothetical protein
MAFTAIFYVGSQWGKSHTKAQNKWCRTAICYPGIAMQSPQPICNLLHKITPKLIRNVKNYHTKLFFSIAMSEKFHYTSKKSYSTQAQRSGSRTTLSQKDGYNSDCVFTVYERASTSRPLNYTFFGDRTATAQIMK